MKVILRRTMIVFAAVFITGLAGYAGLSMPRTWNLSAPNLQIRLEKVKPAIPTPGLISSGCGWSKWDYLCSRFTSRECLLMDGTGGPGGLTARIVGATARGVSIRIINQGVFGSVWFDRTVFVPSDKPARVNLLNEVWFTGAFVR